MNNLVKMRMLTAAKPDGDNMPRRGNVEPNYESYRSGDIDNRFRDNRGREHYDNGRYAPMRSEYDRPMRSEYDRDYESTEMRTEPRRSWEIIENNDRPMRYTNNWENHADEEKNESPRVIGFASAATQRKSPMFNREMAEEWMSNIRNTDRTKGAHWTLDEVKQVMRQKGIEADPVKMWAAINAEYSDRCAIAKKYNVDRLDYYIDSALAFWLDDEDAVKDKLGAYYTHVVKH